MAKKSSPPRKFLFEEVLEFLDRQHGKALNYRQISAGLGIRTGEERHLINDLLADMLEKGLVEETDRGKFRSKTAQHVFTGTADITSTGAAYVTVEDRKEDIYVAPRFTGGALNGDTVRIKLFTRKRSDGREEGEIIEIVKRARSEFVGIIEIHGKQAFVTPDNNKLHIEFIIPPGKTGNARNGQKVVVRIVEWDEFSDQPTGEVIAVLGNPGEHETEINAVMAEFGLPPKFPNAVEQAASKIPVTISEKEISRRRDFRDVTTFTIDPVDAKDFDDALSVRTLGENRWEVGVHIADVSHYMEPGSILDEEAINRATSVYLVDRVIPMLPEVLSNYVCSLRPFEDKLCFSAVFELDENANVISEWFGRTVIHSRRRYAYEEVQEILEGKEGDYKAELHLLDTLAKKLRHRRLNSGSITFDKEEVKFHLDENGNPIGVFFKVMKDANQLIEDFMLLANRRVAEYVGLSRKAGNAKNPAADLRRTFVYRVHSAPDPERMKEFSTFVRGFGYSMNFGSEQAIAGSLNKLLKDVAGKPEANLIETLAIRSMAKAYYTTKNIGHYGLGFDYYTHFTSPIRRYPDVLAHRLLQYYLDVDAQKNPTSIVDDKRLEVECKHSSEREKNAAEAERASIKYMQVKFLGDKIGQAFDGVVSGVMDFGFFVEIIENKCEGLVRMANLKDDYYVFEADQYRIRGQRKGRTFTLGDRVRIRIRRADLLKKQLDFELDEENDFYDFPPAQKSPTKRFEKPFHKSSKKHSGGGKHSGGHGGGKKHGGGGKKRRR